MLIFWTFPSTGTHLKEHCSVYICVKLQVDILKNYEVSIFWWSKMVTFHAVFWDFCIFHIFKFCTNWTVQSALESFSRSWRKTGLKYVSHHPNPNFQFSFSLTSWHCMTLTLNVLTDLMLALRSDPDTIHAGLLICFHLMRLSRVAKPDMTKRQTFGFDLKKRRLKR